jgi:YVTN family beta-propeller protein
VATFSVKRTVKTGWGPVGLVTDRTGKTLYVANSIADSVSLIDLASGAEIKRFTTHRYPEQVLLSRDGRRVYVANLLPHLGPYDQPPVSELLVLDTTRQVVAERILIPGAIELRHIAEAPLQGGYLIVPLVRPKNLGPLIQVNQGWTMTHGMAVVRPAHSTSMGDTGSKVTQVLLDDIDYYFAGNDGVAFTPDGRRALVTSSDADTVSLLDTAHLGQKLRQYPGESSGFRRHLRGKAPADGTQSDLGGDYSRQPLGLHLEPPRRFRDHHRPGTIEGCLHDRSGRTQRNYADAAR